MRYKVFMSVLLGMSVLCVSACGSSRQATSSSTFQGSSVQELRDSVKVESVAVSDSVMEVTTVTIRENEQGDTLRMTTVTDRTRIRDRERVKDMEVKVVEKHDTVFVQKTDSMFVQNTNLTNDTNRASPFVSSLKWIFWIIIAIGGLIIVVWVALRLKI